MKIVFAFDQICVKLHKYTKTHTLYVIQEVRNSIWKINSKRYVIEITICIRIRRN